MRCRVAQLSKRDLGSLPAKMAIFPGAADPVKV
jgi:hypothetical protein